MSLSDLTDEVKRSEEFQTRNAEELERVVERLASLEEVPRVNLELVSHANRAAAAPKRGQGAPAERPRRASQGQAGSAE